MSADEPADPLRTGLRPWEPEPVGLPPAFADGSFSHLHPNYIRTERISWLIFGTLLAIAGLTAFIITLITLGPGDAVPWLVLAGWLVMEAVVVAAGVLLPRKAYAATTYAVSPLGLEIRRGIWWRHVIDVPRARIQHTDVQQGPVARHYGLGKLIVYTAGTEHASVELDGLQHERAVELRDFLLQGGEDDAV